MSWLKDEAPLNILNIVVTPEVSHALMSSLKDDAPLNKSCMSVTPDVSQVEMSRFGRPRLLRAIPFMFQCCCWSSRRYPPRCTMTSDLVSWNSTAHALNGHAA